ncbi:putative coil containing protein [Vibrio phage 141O35-1]|nr:putative coil containing protein [Vibrio phage 141O35-1]CAH9016410.1 putative coil containing protein [Vibrio phage 141E35-1]
MNPIPARHAKLRNVLISKLGLPADRSQRDNEIAEAVVKLIEERDEAVSQLSEITKTLVEADLMRRNINSSIDVLIKERGVVQGTINGLKQLLELPESAGLTELFNTVEALELNKPQLNEIRYVLHGDIQPCSVLYSDDTTTLLRLDEGDIMCETDAIEWSDSVTYRCQELLKSTWAGTGTMQTRYAEALSQLVRDERILLNDNEDDESVETFVPTLDERTRPADIERDVASRKWTDKLSEHLASQPKQER